MESDPVLRRHADLCAVEKHEENELWALIVMLLQGILGASALVSMLHPEAVAFIHQLIEAANLYRVHAYQYVYDNTVD